MKVLREQWFIYEIDNEGRLKHPRRAWDGYVFEQYGYDTEQEAKDDLLSKVDTAWESAPYFIVKGYTVDNRGDE